MEELLKLVTEEVNANPDNIEVAVDNVIRKGSRRQAWQDWTADLIRKGVLQLVHDRRHCLNVTMRNANGEYGGPAKVTIGKATSRIMAGVYSYLIAGKTLGMVTGDELPDIAASEAARADGHQFNARLCLKLARLVKGDKTVKECVSEVKLKALFEKI